MKYKTALIFLSLTISLTTLSAFASQNLDNYDLYKPRVAEVLEKRKIDMIKKISSKIGTKYDEIEKNMVFQPENDEIKVMGHVTGNYGVCEITGAIKVLETSVSGKCITKDHRISIIWP